MTKFSERKRFSKWRNISTNLVLIFNRKKKIIFFFFKKPHLSHILGKIITVFQINRCSASDALKFILDHRSF